MMNYIEFLTYCTLIVHLTLGEKCYPKKTPRYSKLKKIILDVDDVENKR
jgi:hypothetical protein